MFTQEFRTAVETEPQNLKAEKPGTCQLSLEGYIKERHVALSACDGLTPPEALRIARENLGLMDREDDTGVRCSLARIFAGSSELLADLGLPVIPNDPSWVPGYHVEVRPNE